MSHPTTYKDRVRVAHWSQLERWDAKAAQASVWQGSAHELRPLAEALSRYRANVPRTDSALADWQLVTVRFDGNMEPRTAKGTATFKGKLFAALPGQVIYSKIDARNGAIGIIPENLPRVAVSSEFPVYAIRADVASPAYIKILFRSAQFQRLIQRLVSGASGRKRVEPAALERLAVPLPPLPVQAAIVEAYETGVAEAARLRHEAKGVEQQVKELFAGSYGLNTQGAAVVPKCFTLKWSEIDRWSLNYLGRTHFATPTVAGAFPTVSLGELTQGRSGGTPSKRNLAFWQGAIPWVSPKDMKVYELHDAEDHISEMALEESAASLLPVNSILLVVRSGILQRLVPVGINRVPVTINQDIRAFTVTDERLLPDFLGAYLRAAQSELLRLVKTGVTVESINREELENLAIPLPPLDVQMQLLEQDDLLRSQAATLRTLATETEAVAVARVEAMILGQELLPAQVC